MKHKVILDCDNTMGMPSWEVDDGLVILYLLGRDDIDLLGITNVFGNASLEDVVTYTKQLMQEIGRTDIPKLDGEAYREQNPNLKATLKHVERYANERAQTEEITDAARFLSDMVNTYPGEITILAAGPVSNLYKAQKINNSFYSKVKEIVCMGGYIEDLYIGGNLLAELNLACDPKASREMLFSECPVTVMTGQVCLQAPFGKREIERAGFWPERRTKLLYDWLDKFGTALNVDVFYLWDLLLPVYVSYPELFEKNETWINPSEKDLEKGMLMPSEQGIGTTINMPMNITEQNAFMDILFEAWKEEWIREQKWIK